MALAIDKGKVHVVALPKSRAEVEWRRVLFHALNEVEVVYRNPIIIIIIIIIITSAKEGGYGMLLSALVCNC